jgi:hypothetical protein
MKIANGVVNFCGEMRKYLEDTKESFDTVLNRHYQANHTPYAVMSFEDEAHYWEEQLAYPINKVIRPTDSDDEYLSRVGVLRLNSYVFIRGNLKSGSTIRYDETKYQQLYINGERYTGDYTFNGETPDIYERVTVFIVQTPYNITTREWGELIVDVADFPIENAEIYVNIGENSNVQPEIEELLLTDTAESLYVNGSWVWMCRDYSSIKTLSVTETFNFHSQSTQGLRALVNYFVPNSKHVPNVNSKAIFNIDVRNAGGISDSAFHSSLIKGHLNLSNTGVIGVSAFNNCTRLTSVDIGNGVTRLNNGAFAYCSNLNTVIIGDNVTDILPEAFRNCSIKTLHIGKSVVFSDSNYANTFATQSGSTEKLTVSKGYRASYTPLWELKIPVDLCLDIFKGILENCANVGEDGRTAAKMSFRVTSSVRTAITNAYNEGDETALAIYELMDSKNISITA